MGDARVIRLGETVDSVVFTVRGSPVDPARECVLVFYSIGFNLS